MLLPVEGSSGRIISEGSGVRSISAEEENGASVKQFPLNFQNTEQYQVRAIFNSFNQQYHCNHNMNICQYTV